MAMRTRTDLVCECGQKGYHLHSENDQPYGKDWHQYSLEGFRGGGPDQDDVTQMTCTKCGAKGKVARA